MKEKSGGSEYLIELLKDDRQRVGSILLIRDLRCTGGQ